MNINLDEGYLYGIGLFETIAIKKGDLLFPEYHYMRLKDGIEKLRLASKYDINKVKKESEWYAKKCEFNNGVLKIIFSKDNLIYQVRENKYSKEQYDKGFKLKLSSVNRNESSVFTSIKSLNYGDNIIEKRNAITEGFDEPIFLNFKRELSEGATTNIFFVKDGDIITPKLRCGALNGTIRKYLIENYDVDEAVVYKFHISEFDEIFVTNSLMGIMPVWKFDDYEFDSRKITNKLTEDLIEKGLHPIL